MRRRDNRRGHQGFHQHCLPACKEKGANNTELCPEPESAPELSIMGSDFNTSLYLVALIKVPSGDAMDHDDMAISRAGRVLSVLH